MKKILALILTVSLCLSLAPTGAFAEETEPAPETETGEILVPAEEVPTAEEAPADTGDETAPAEPGTEEPATGEEPGKEETTTGEEQGTEEPTTPAEPGTEEPTAVGSDTEQTTAGEEPEEDEETAGKASRLAKTKAPDEPDAGECGEDAGSVFWKFNESTGTLTIYGTGAMADYELQKIPWYNLSTKVKTICVDEGVTRIGEYAFGNMSAVREVSLPDTLTAIGSCAFLSCGVKHINLPDSLEKIDTYAFDGSGLTSVEIPRKITNIKKSVFGSCSDLASVVFHGTVTSIDMYAFRNCGKLTDFPFPYALNSIGLYAFTNCGLTSVSFPEYVTSIPEGAFEGCGALEKVTFFGNIVSIGESAFYKCDSISKVHCPNMTEEEWAAVFFGRLNYPLTRITPICGPEFHGKCGDRVSWVYDDLSKALFISGTGGTYDYPDTAQIPWYSHREDILTVWVEEGVTGLGNNVLCGLGREETKVSLSLPSSLEKIGPSAFSRTHITSVVIPDKVRKISESTFRDCSDLESVTLPEGLESIGAYTFDSCSALKDIALPDSLDRIEDFAFAFTGLTHITLPEKIDRIGNYVFRNCYSLETVEYKGTIRSIGGQAFVACNKLKNFTIPDSLESIGYGAFWYDSALSSATLPANITTVPGNLFCGCTGLKEVCFRGKLEEIKFQAFYNCDSLTDVFCTGMTEYEWSLVTIGEENEALTEATIHFKPEDGVTLRLDKSYLLLSQSETVGPIGYTASPAGSYTVYWFAADEDMRIDPAAITENAVISVDRDGKITALGEGTAYVIASLTEKPGDLSTFCRVDVTAKDAPSEELVTGVTVQDSKTDVEIYKTDYAQIRLILELKQNMRAKLMAYDPDLLYPDDRSPEPKAGGHSIVAAEFTENAVKELFELSIKDDRTLEIIPRDETIRKCLSGDRSVKSSYKTALKVTVAGRLEPFTSNSFTLNVKKTMPSIKATTVKLNKVELNSTEAECKEEILLTLNGGGSVRVEPDISKAVPIPAGMELAEGENAVKLTDRNLKKGSYKLYLLASSEGWAIKKQITVSVSVTETYPSVKFTPSTISLNPNVPQDMNTTEMIVTPDLFSAPSLYPVTAVNIYEGKNPVENGAIIRVEAQEGLPRRITVSNGSAAPADGKAHTYTVKVSIAGKEYPFTVKLAAKSARITMKLKAAGTINTKIPRSETVVTSTFKNLNTGVLPKFEKQIDMYVGSKLVKENVEGLFNVTEDLGTFRVSLVKGMEPKVESGTSYKLKVKYFLNEELIETVSIKIPLTIATKTPVPSATLKMSGAIDVIRPGSTVTVIPTIKNYFGYEPDASHIRIFAVEGKKESDVTQYFEIVPNTDDGSFAITARGGENLVLTKKYSVFFDPNITYGDPELKMPGKSAALKVTMGSVKFTADPKKVSLYAKDRHDKGLTVISTSDVSVSDVKRIELSGTRAKALETIRIGENTYMIGYKDNALPTSVKSGTVSVKIWLIGNTGTKPNVTLNITA